MFLCVALPAILLCGCGRKPKVSTSGTTDEMFTDTQYDAKIYAFMYEDRVYTVDSIDEIKTYAAESMKNGGFYKLTADVNYLNAGSQSAEYNKKQIWSLSDRRLLRRGYFPQRIRKNSDLEGRCLDIPLRQTI